MVFSYYLGEGGIGHHLPNVFFKIWGYRLPLFTSEEPPVFHIKKNYLAKFIPVQIPISILVKFPTKQEQSSRARQSRVSHDKASNLELLGCFEILLFKRDCHEVKISFALIRQLVEIFLHLS